jgi:hypothetical protein
MAPRATDYSRELASHNRAFGAAWPRADFTAFRMLLEGPELLIPYGVIVQLDLLAKT